MRTTSKRAGSRRHSRRLALMLWVLPVAGGIADEPVGIAAISEARRLAAESREVGTAHPVRRLLLAVEAVRATQRHGAPLDASAHAALQDALAGVRGWSLGRLGSAAQISPDGRWLADRNQLWQLAPDQIREGPLLLPGHKAPVLESLFTPDSQQLITVSEDLVVRWSLAGEHPRALPLSQESSGWSRAGLSGDGRWLVVSRRDTGAAAAGRLWDLAAAAPADSGRDLRGHPGPLTMFQFSPDSRWLATADGHNLRLRDLRAEKPAESSRALAGHDGYITMLNFSSDGRWLLTADRARTRLWPLPRSQPEVVLDIDGTPRQDSLYFRYTVFTPDSRWMVLGGQNGQLRLWKLSAEGPAASPHDLHRFEGGVQDMEVSRDSRWLMASGVNSQDARLWDLKAPGAPQAPALLEGRNRPLEDLLIAPHGRLAVAAADSGNILLWDLGIPGPRQRARLLPGHAGRINRLVFSPDGDRLISDGADRTVRVWELDPPFLTETPRVLRGHEAATRIVTLSADGRWLVTFGRGGRLWNLDSPEEATWPRVLRGAPDSDVIHLELSPDERRLVTCGSHDLAPRVWNLSDPWPTVIELPGLKRAIQSFTVSPDHRWLAIGSRLEEHGLLWDLDALHMSTRPRILSGHQGINKLAVSSDGRWLVSGGYVVGGSIDSTWRLWNLQAETPAARSLALEADGNSVFGPHLSAKGRWLLTGGGKTARLWDLHAAAPADSVRALGPHISRLRSEGLSGDGRWAYTLEWDSNQLHLWELQPRGPAARHFELGKVEFRDVGFTADSRWLVARRDKSTARLWDLTSNRNPPKSRDLPDFGRSFYAAAFSPEGRWLAATSSDQRTRLWDLQAKMDHAPAVLKGHERGVYRILFSPDGRWLVTGGNGYSAPLLWKLPRNPAAPLEAPVELPGNIGRVERFKFSADGRWLATSDLQSVHVWDLRSPQPAQSPRRFHSQGEYLAALAFSPSGHALICGYRRGATRMWLLNPRQLLDHARQRAGRELTSQERIAHGLPVADAAP